MICCQARVSSTLASPLPSVVMTSVGQIIFGTSPRMSAHESCPPLDAFRRKAAAEATGHNEAAEVVDQTVEGPGVFPRHGRGRTETAHIRTHHATAMRKLRNPPVPRSATFRVAVQCSIRMVPGLLQGSEKLSTR
jgi:hypothetical protein